MKLKYEPNLIAGGGMGAVMALLVYYRVLDVEAAGLWAVALGFILPPIQGFIARFFTMATRKIRDAGHDPEMITADAKRNTGR